MRESLHQRGASGESAGRLWPVNLVIALLAGSTLGAVAATADFAEPRQAWNRGGWLALVGNGWAQAAMVLVLLGVLSASAALLRRAAARRVQFC
ncbi:MAG: hypothetical protein NUV77_17905, partial [Thermoguttaceae bacterium]|nr:hypothetical protein [Thermoguttaceae bacterium]